MIETMISWIESFATETFEFQEELVTLRELWQKVKDILLHVWQYLKQPDKIRTIQRLLKPFLVLRHTKISVLSMQASKSGPLLFRSSKKSYVSLEHSFNSFQRTVTETLDCHKGKRLYSLASAVKKLFVGLEVWKNFFRLQGFKRLLQGLQIMTKSTHNFWHNFPDDQAAVGFKV